jgi:hypothetical protein
VHYFAAREGVPTQTAETTLRSGSALIRVRAARRTLENTGSGRRQVLSFQSYSCPPFGPKNTLARRGEQPSRTSNPRPPLAIIEMCPYAASRESGDATPAAQHSPPWRASGLHLPVSASSIRVVHFGKSTGRFGHLVKCAHLWCPVSQARQPQPHCIHGAGPTKRTPISASFNHLAHRRHWPEKHRSQNGCCGVS